MSNLPKICTPGYPLSGGSAAFAGDNHVHGTRMQWGRIGRNADAARVQLIVPDVPGQMSALSLVRRT